MNVCFVCRGAGLNCRVRTGNKNTKAGYSNLSLSCHRGFVSKDGSSGGRYGASNYGGGQRQDRDRTQSTNERDGNGAQPRQVQLLKTNSATEMNSVCTL